MPSGPGSRNRGQAARCTDRSLLNPLLFPDERFPYQVSNHGLESGMGTRDGHVAVAVDRLGSGVEGSQRTGHSMKSWLKKGSPPKHGVRAIRPTVQPRPSMAPAECP